MFEWQSSSRSSNNNNNNNSGRDHHAEALHRFYNFARGLDSYRAGVRDVKLSFVLLQPRTGALGGEFHFIRFETRRMQNAMDLIRAHKLPLNKHSRNGRHGRRRAQIRRAVAERTGNRHQEARRSALQCWESATPFDRRWTGSPRRPLHRQQQQHCTKKNETATMTTRRSSNIVVGTSNHPHIQNLDPDGGPWPISDLQSHQARAADRTGPTLV